jgi:hypothetical protein
MSMRPFAPRAGANSAVTSKPAVGAPPSRGYIDDVLKPPPRILVAVQRLLIRLARTPLRRLLAVAYLGLARVGAWYLTRGLPGATAYVRGGPGDPDFWPGLSDLDLVLVVADDPGSPGGPAACVRERWRRLQARFPLAKTVLDWPRVYEQAELRDFADSSAFTYGLEPGGNTGAVRAAYFGPRASLDAVRVLERPGLYAPAAGWRRLSGHDRRPHDVVRDEQARRIAGWLELLYWWRWAVRFCVFPIEPRVADLSAKLIAETARIWLWLAHGERASSREDVLERALTRLPEEEDALGYAIDLRRRLPDSPEEPLRHALPSALRMSTRIAQLLGYQVAEHGTSEVRLVGAEGVGAMGDGPEAGRLPLVDWRALACATAPDESLLSLGGDPSDPSQVAAAATSHRDGPYPVLSADGLLLMPAAELVRSRLRAVKCPTVDPVVFAVVAGSDVASFPRVRGWSAADTARRAVAEHRARLAVASPSVDGGEPAMLAAARAGLFAESIERDEPELCLTPTAVRERLEQTGRGAESVDRETVLALPAYRRF